MSEHDRESRPERGLAEARSSGDGGLVERLLEAAAAGPEVPADGAERVKASIRESWRSGVAERARRRRRLWVGGLAAAAAVLLAVVYLTPDRPAGQQLAAFEPLLERVAGTIEVTPPGATVSFRTAEDEGTAVPLGSLLRTRDAGRAAIRLADGVSLRIDRDTEARLDSARSISLDAGAIYVGSGQLAKSGVEVRTAFGTARDVGTQFEVRLGSAQLDVRVREGLVALLRNGDEYEITHGISLTVNSDGAVSSAVVTTYDESWDWVQEVAPVFEIEGRSALEFLDWYSSETGRSIRFSDPDVERLARTTILHGSMEGIPIAAAPAALLPSCRLQARVEPGSLLVRPLAEDANTP